MATKLLLPYAYDSKGKLVHIDNAQKGHKYICPNCGAELLLKLSKIPEGQKYHRRNHFAHKGNADNHCSESFLHKYFKEKCAEYISAKISAQEDFIFEWECEKCHENHKGNLLKKAVKVVIEYDLGICKPDIALFDDSGNVVIVIEIVVTHEPEPNALKYYEDNRIACLQIDVKDFEDCEKIIEKLSHPNKVNLCPNPICEKCGHRKNTASMITMIKTCEVCNEKIKVVFICTSTSAKYLNPHSFTKTELETAMQLKANIVKKYSETSKQYYYVNACPHCNSIVGDINDHWYDELHYYTPYEDKIKVGVKCQYCIDPYSYLYDELNDDELNDGGGESCCQPTSVGDKTKRCPVCHGVLVVRNNRNGQQFFGCENYPNCRYTAIIR